MADYFNNFSLVLTLPNEETRKYALDLAEQAQAEEILETFPASLRDVIEDWAFDTDPSDNCGLWLHSSSGGVDAMCAFIQHLLQSFDPSGCVTFEWSHDCSKPRVDAFGGGAAIITAENVKSMTTSEWLQKHA